MSLNYLNKLNPYFYYLLVMLLGSTLSLTFPPDALIYLVFITMTIFILGLEIRDKQSSFWYGYIFYLGAVIAFIGYWFSYYFRLQLDCGYLISYLLTMTICLYTSLYIGVICFIYIKLKTRSSIFNLIILFPSLWVLTELIRGQFFPRSWYALGYTQVDTYLFRGYFPILGVYFVSWLIVAIAGCLTYFLLKLKTWPKKITAISVSALVFIILSYTLAQIQYTKKYGQPITIALLQPSIFSSKNYNYDTLFELENISALLIKQNHADLIVLPETVFGTDYRNLSAGYLTALSKYAASKHEVVIFGTPIRGDNENHTTGILNSSQLQAPIYRKHYLVPFGEYNPIQGTFLAPLISSFSDRISHYIPGDELQPPAEILGQRFAFNICYENSVNDYVAQNAKLATILLNQSDLSWYGRTKMKDAFLQFSQGRALENQRYFVQDGNTGDTAVINPQGVIEQRIPAFTSGGLVASIQGYSGTTPFQHVCNIPMWLLCIGVLISALVLKLKQYWQRKQFT